MPLITLSPTAQRQIAQAVEVLRAWNAAIALLRTCEAAAQQPGRYEYDLRYTDAGADLRTQLAQALARLARLEATAQRVGLDSRVLYAHCGGKPALVAEGEAVAQWRQSGDGA